MTKVDIREQHTNKTEQTTKNFQQKHQLKDQQ